MEQHGHTLFRALHTVHGHVPGEMVFLEIPPANTDAGAQAPPVLLLPAGRWAVILFSQQVGKE